MTVSDAGAVEAYIQGDYNNTQKPTVSATLDLKQEWNTITLVGSKNASNMLFLDLYFNGINVSTGSVSATNFATETANLLSFGLYGDSSPSASMNIDNILVYNKALTSKEVAQLIPEPATATLSLLALAGLAARRRRATR